MNFYVEAQERSDQHPRTHPLLLSLTEAYGESDNAPNISSVPKNDVRAQQNNYYMPPNELPPLDIHFDGQNGIAPIMTVMILGLHWKLLAKNVWHLNHQNIWWRQGMKQWICHRQLSI